MSSDPMSAWTSDELTRIEAADELELASLRGDGTLRRPVTIWVVRHGDDLYVRSVNGSSAAWFRATQVRHEGHISAGGVHKDVVFADVDRSLDDELDAAYRAKYRRYGAGILGTILTSQARSVTLKVVSRTTRLTPPWVVEVEGQAEPPQRVGGTGPRCGPERTCNEANGERRDAGLDLVRFSPTRSFRNEQLSGQEAL
jgi:hypothetical protein